MDRLPLSERAARICDLANSLSDELAHLGLPEPTFEHGLPTLPHDDGRSLKASLDRHELLEILDETRALLTEPTLLLTPELVSLQPSKIRGYTPYLQ